MVIQILESKKHHIGSLNMFIEQVLEADLHIITQDDIDVYHDALHTAILNEYKME